MEISRGAAYFIVLICGFSLLFPGGAFQTAYSHPYAENRNLYLSSSQYEKLVEEFNTNDARNAFEKCHDVRVTVYIKKVLVHWNYTTPEQRESFNEVGEGKAGAKSLYNKGEVEMLYKMWEPGHGDSPIHGVSDSKSAQFKEDNAKVSHAFQIKNWIIDFIKIDPYNVNLGDKRFFKNDDFEWVKNNPDGSPKRAITEQYIQALKKAGAEKVEGKNFEIKKYEHYTCANLLDEIMILFSASESDKIGVFDTKPSEVDAILGANIAETIAANKKKNTDSSLKNFFENGMESKFKGTIEQKAKDKIVTLLTNGAVTKYIPEMELAKTFGKKVLVKTTQLFLGTKSANMLVILFFGPGSLFVWASGLVSTTFDLYNWGKDDREYLGFAGVSINLKEVTRDVEEEYIVSTQKVYAPTCALKKKQDSDVITYSPQPYISLVSFKEKWPIPIGKKECYQVYFDNPEFWKDSFGKNVLQLSKKYVERAIDDYMLETLCKNNPTGSVCIGNPAGTKAIETARKDFKQYVINDWTEVAKVFSTVFKEEAQKAKEWVSETEPYYAGTVSVTFSVLVEDVGKCEDKKCVTPTCIANTRNTQGQSIELQPYTYVSYSENSNNQTPIFNQWIKDYITKQNDLLRNVLEKISLVEKTEPDKTVSDLISELDFSNIESIIGTSFEDKSDVRRHDVVHIESEPRSEQVIEPLDELRIIKVIPQEDKIKELTEFPWYKGTASWKFEFEDGTPFSGQSVSILINDNPEWKGFVKDYRASRTFYDTQPRYGAHSINGTGYTTIEMYTPGNHTLSVDFVFLNPEGRYHPTKCEDIEITVPEHTWEAKKPIDLIRYETSSGTSCEKATWYLVDKNNVKAPFSQYVLYNDNDNGPFQSQKLGSSGSFTLSYCDGIPHTIKIVGMLNAYTINGERLSSEKYGGDGDEFTFFSP